MISAKIQDAINAQINRELYSEYLYLAMAAWAYDQNWNGIGGWLDAQAAEEHSHGLRFVKYLVDRGGRVQYKAIAEPKGEFASVEEVFRLALEHERFVTKSIYELTDLAIKENDHATRTMLTWFIDEQVEEESNFETLVAQLGHIEGSKGALYHFDHQLGKRKAE